MFARDVGIDELLGKPTRPQELTLAELRKDPAKLGAVALTKVLGNLFYRTFSSRSKINIHQLWIETYAEAMLKPFGLGNVSQYMAADEESVERIIARNPHLRREDFLVQLPTRPQAFVMGGTLLGPPGFSPNEDSAVSLQISPDFTGSPFYANDGPVHYKGSHGQEMTMLVGGGFVESFAFGSSSPSSPKSQEGGRSVKLEAPARPFSLADAVGISSAAFAAVMVQASTAVTMAGWFTGIDARNLLPIRDVWPVTSEKFPEQATALKFELGDGAESDNTGLMACLQRGVAKVAVFLNSNRRLDESFDFCRGHLEDLKGKVSNDLVDKFGFAIEGVGDYLAKNQVFSKSELPPLLCDLQRLRKSGKPLVVSRELEVLKNEKWGILGGWKVSVVFTYLGQSSLFNRQLPTETLQEMGRGSSGSFAHFPHFKTTFQNSGRFTSYTAEQVNLLAALSEFAVRQNGELFADLLK